MIPNYETKHNYLFQRHRGYCPIARSRGRLAAVTDLHHAGVHNTKVNRARYPLLINSLWNLVAVNRGWHMQYPSWGRIPYLEAEKREAFLRRHPAIAARLNNPGGEE